MHVGIYTPYLLTLGGGEKYMLSIADVFAKDHVVDVFLGTHIKDVDVNILRKKIDDLHGLDLTEVNFIEAPFWPGSSFFERIKFLKKYDLLFYLSDGSLFYSTSKKSIVHFQQPLTEVSIRGLWGRKKMKSWDLAIYNSEFTKKYIEKLVRLPGEVVYPPIDVDFFKPLFKKKQIITVGRFQSFTKSKKQSLMIDVFKKLNKESKIKGWSLHLAGGVSEGDQEYLNDLKKQAEGEMIEFYPNIDINKLAKLYGESQIYWHAAGFEEIDPAKMEHFGITTVEAMASGCVPVVINKGGQIEIVEDGVSGFLWGDIDELKDKSLQLMNNEGMFSKMSKNAKKRSYKFSKRNFEEKILRLI